MKKLISIILICALLFSITINALAAGIEETEDSGVIVTEHRTEASVSESEKLKYEKYNFDFSQVPVSVALETEPPEINEKEYILSLCTVGETVVLENANATVTELYSDDLAQYIPFCDEVAEICLINKTLYVSYTTTDGKTIIVSFNDNGFNDRCVYDVEADEAFYESADVATEYSNFHQGTTVEMSDELIGEIDRLIENNDIDGLKQIEEISVIEFENGTYAVEPKINTQVNTGDVMPLTTGFTNTSALLSDLKADFPMYTGTLKGNYGCYCKALDKNISVRVRESRNAYSKTSANYSSFAIGTAITVIAAFLVPKGALPIIVAKVTNMLNALSIGISAADTILSAVTLYNSARYTYVGERIGYAYDSTIYNDYVRVVNYYGKGEFTGGYNSNGDFTWVVSQVSSAYNHAYTDIRDKTISNYNSCIVSYGDCEVYYPD